MLPISRRTRAILAESLVVAATILLTPACDGAWGDAPSGIGQRVGMQAGADVQTAPEDDSFYFSYFLQLPDGEFTHCSYYASLRDRTVACVEPVSRAGHRILSYDAAEGLLITGGPRAGSHPAGEADGTAEIAAWDASSDPARPRQLWRADVPLILVQGGARNEHGESIWVWGETVAWWKNNSPLQNRLIVLSGDGRPQWTYDFPPDVGVEEVRYNARVGRYALAIRIYGDRTGWKRTAHEERYTPPANRSSPTTGRAIGSRGQPPQDLALLDPQGSGTLTRFTWGKGLPASPDAGEVPRLLTSISLHRSARFLIGGLDTRLYIARPDPGALPYVESYPGNVRGWRWSSDSCLLLLRSVERRWRKTLYQWTLWDLERGGRMVDLEWRTFPGGRKDALGLMWREDLARTSQGHWVRIGDYEVTTLNIQYYRLAGATLQHSRFSVSLPECGPPVSREAPSILLVRDVHVNSIVRCLASPAPSNVE